METILRETASDLGIVEQVHFLGVRSDVPQILTALDAFVLPSLREGLSNAVMEAMAMECPVIATDVGGQREVVIDGETGLLVQPADAGALRSALMRLIGQKEFADYLGRNARRFLEENFEQDKWMREAEMFLCHTASPRDKA